MTDANLDYYELSYSRLGSEQWTVFARRTENISDGLLGIFDPTLLPNDEYLIRVEAWDVNGLSSVGFGGGGDRLWPPSVRRGPIPGTRFQ